MQETACESYKIVIKFVKKGRNNVICLYTCIQSHFLAVAVSYDPSHSSLGMCDGLHDASCPLYT